MKRDSQTGKFFLRAALDGLHRDWIIRRKGIMHMEIRPGVWVPLRARAMQPVLRDLSVRRGKSYGDQVYPAAGVGTPQRGNLSTQKPNSRRAVAITINWGSASSLRHNPIENLKTLTIVVTNRVDTVLE